MLTPAQIEEYREVGAIVVPDVLTPQEVAELRRVTDDMIEASRAFTTHTDIYDFEETHTPEHPRVRRIKKTDECHPAYGALVRHPNIVAVLRDLWGPDIRFDSAKLNMKSAGFGAAVEWHQDWAFYPHTNDDLAAVGVMMDDMLPANGPLLVIPGSHRGPTYDHHGGGKFVGAIDPATTDIDFSRAIPLLGPAGSITVHHVRAIHGSALNTSDRDRRLLLFQFRAADAWPLIRPPTDIAAYDRLMVSGQPREPRLAGGLPVRVPLPQTDRTGSIYERQAGMRNRYFEVVATPEPKIPQAAK